jgi:hypothetical protein
MGNPLARLGVSDEEFTRALRESAEVDSMLDEKMREVVDYARSVAPVETGAYAAGIKVTKKARHGRGEVAATDWKSHWVEYGTSAPEHHGGGPTPAFGVMEKTAARFGGTLGKGDDS